MIRQVIQNLVTPGRLVVWNIVVVAICWALFQEFQHVGFLPTYRSAQTPLNENVEGLFEEGMERRGELIDWFDTFQVRIPLLYPLSMSHVHSLSFDRALSQKSNKFIRSFITLPFGKQC